MPKLLLHPLVTDGNLMHHKFDECFGAVKGIIGEAAAALEGNLERIKSNRTFNRQ